MNITDLKRVNDLWKKVYPYLASQIMEEYQRNSGSILELGPFSGGISRELMVLYPELKVTIAAESPDVIEYIDEEIEGFGLSEKIDIIETSYNSLVFSDDRFDLVILRGGFFLLDSGGQLFREIFRVLKPGGMAFVGGGYGKDIPLELIGEIADESRELNDRLGRVRVGVEELKEIIKRSQLAERCSIVEKGGLWVYIRK
ncbi:MAG: class I SAM-dependent methyltransferase [Syntrophaceae bacterium]|nr:class I SAM-dependent methyltransferase [Syntrophaceae bacterium]